MTHQDWRVSYLAHTHITQLEIQDKLLCLRQDWFKHLHFGK